MPTLFEQVRERFTTTQDALRSLQQEVSDAGGEETDEQTARLRDLQTEVTRLGPRLEQLADIERTIAATSAVLARAPMTSVAGSGPGTRDPENLYRSAGEYLCDFLQARQGDRPATDRIAAYHARAAQNQTTVDNPGIVPDPIVGSVVNYVDTMRPLATSFGIRALPAYPTFHRPHVTQHTSVALQSAEKTELASRKMTITRLNVTAETFGGYVDLSLQDRDFTNPAIMGILIDDLAGQYALATETATWSKLSAVAQTQSLESDATADAIVAAIYAAAGKVYAGVKQLPDVVYSSVDQWARLGPLFPSIGPSNVSGSGFSASQFGGQVTGLRLVVAPALPAGTIIVGSTQAAEVYEQRVGVLQALEVSLLGMQVGYAGYFAAIVLEPLGFCKLTDQTP